MMLYRAVAFLCVLGFSQLAFSQSTPLRLFDGKSLSGWDFDAQYWRVEDGAIVGEIAPGTRLRKNTWLVWTAGELEDFDLRFQFRLSGQAGANSGVQIRCQVESVDHVSGYQADLDMGQVWLGRIYDEHGRALLVERGTRVRIDENGEKQAVTFAPKSDYEVLFREGLWNEYRVVGHGDRLDVYINGTLFSQLQDKQQGERDLRGKLAFQLHSGGETKIEFRRITVEELKAKGQSRLAKFELPEAKAKEEPENAEEPPADDEGKHLNLGFELGSLQDWSVEGEAFVGQPVQNDGIASRWPGQSSNKAGNYFVGGFELERDRPTGTLTSKAFRASQPYASFLIGGGKSEATRAEIVTLDREGKMHPFFQASGQDREQMRRVVADLRSIQGAQIAVRLIDESSGGWGHLNFDDFRLHDSPPVPVEPTNVWRSIQNPILQHLVENKSSTLPSSQGSPARTTLEQMYVPEGFSVELVASEPRVHQPIAFTFDPRGRLWVVEGHSYPQKRPAGEGLDRVLILEDQDGDGDFETRKVFVEGLNLVSGIQIGHGGVWIGAAPELLFIPDRDGDDVPDSDPTVLLDGFGFADTHETLNSLMWGPDGWLYGNQGVFNTSRIGKPGSSDSERTALSAGVWRFHPQHHEFEVFAHGGSNQWGLDYDQYGQIFMTHCRSHWGQGATTHVMRGGHYWNQVNGGYADFVSSTALPGMPHMKNYLLASARYGHGEGGAGKRGSKAVYGGHSHVGTMIYLGDNWPQQYRNHLFTLNLHGHQVNQQENRREAGGYETIHAGSDVLFCADPQFVGVDLQVGPDGAVYISDWYDPRHCHNPNAELWDRGNGRIYRMHFQEHRPVQVDYIHASESQLVDAQLHPNHWHARAARLVIADRAVQGSLSPEIRGKLVRLTQHADEVVRLHGLWSMHVAGMVNQALIEQMLHDDSEYVRGWAVQVGCEALEPEQIGRSLVAMSHVEQSLWVCRYLASALDDLTPEHAWQLASTLLHRPIQEDRDLPSLLWFGIARLADQNLERLIALVNMTPAGPLRDYTYWYAAKRSSTGRDALVSRIAHASEVTEQRHWLLLLAHALQGMKGVEPAQLWDEVALRLYESSDRRLREAAENVGASFEDSLLFQRMRRLAGSEGAEPQERLRALELLVEDRSEENLDLLLALLTEDSYRSRVIPLLANYEQLRVAQVVLDQLNLWDEASRTAALELLSARKAWAQLLLDRVAAGKIAKKEITAYFAQQMFNLGDQPLTDRLIQEWGRLGASSSELKEEIQKTLQAYEAAPKWAFSARAGAAHFQKLCASCHQPDQADDRIAPKLEGTQSKGVAYLVENVIDPNAVIGRDYQARVVLTASGQVVTGLVQSETDSSITMKTANNVVTIDKDEVEEMRVSENSFMPQGLLNNLNERERIELFKYVLSL